MMFTAKGRSGVAENCDSVISFVIITYTSEANLTTFSLFCINRGIGRIANVVIS